jgi:hypothetical protein
MCPPVRRKKQATCVEEDIMKTMVSALIAVAVLAGVVAAASADPYAKKFFEQLDRGKF